MSDTVTFTTLTASLGNPLNPPKRAPGRPFKEKWGNDLWITWGRPEDVMQERASGLYQFAFTVDPEYASQIQYPTAIDMAFRERGSGPFHPIKRHKHTKPMWLSRDYNQDLEDTSGIGINDDPSTVGDHDGKWYDVILLMRYVDENGNEHLTIVDPEIHNAPM